MYIDKFTELGYSSICNFKETSVSSMKKASEFLENTRFIVDENEHQP